MNQADRILTNLLSIKYKLRNQSHRNPEHKTVCDLLAIKGIEGKEIK